jgi:nitrogen fixation protein NifX
MEGDFTMSKKVAFASSNGKFVDLQFDHTDSFYIYEIFEDAVDFLETRKVYKLSNQSENQLGSVSILLSDCEVVFVCRINFASARYLFAKGLRVFESPYAVKDILNKLVAEKVFFKVNK